MSRRRLVSRRRGRHNKHHKKGASGTINQKNKNKRFYKSKNPQKTFKSTNMCQWFKSLFGLCDEETVKKQLEELRKDLISENEERLLEEKWKRSEQRDQIDLLKSRLRDMEKKQNNG
jgi:hypothetical protein